MDKSPQAPKSDTALSKRVMSALILVPVLLLALFYAAPWFWILLGLLLTVIAGQEYGLLIPVHTLVYKVAFVLGLLGCLFLSAWLFPLWELVGVLFWLLICAALVTFPESQKYWGYPIVVALIALVLWPFFIQCLSQLYLLPQGKVLIVYLLILVWAADTGAYFVGRYCGSHKLIPKVSPGKSWEGVLGGLILGLVMAWIAYIYFMPYSFMRWIVIALLTLISSVIGDLCVSMLKRRCQLKDTGTLIPGHGGLLDRLDSIIAAAPVFYLGITYLPVGI